MPNKFPVISDIPDQRLDLGTPLPAIFFTVGDFETPAEQLRVVVGSSNPLLAPVANIFLGGIGANRNITIS
ncbi:MAG: hypothetical protein WCG27_10060, partial [Pseudomonadota bacterium]